MRRYRTSVPSGPNVNSPETKGDEQSVQLRMASSSMPTVEVSRAMMTTDGGKIPVVDVRGSCV